MKNDFFITGESYAGHYIPAFASRIQKGNKAKEGVHINLKVYFEYFEFDTNPIRLWLINSNVQTGTCNWKWSY